MRPAISGMAAVVGLVLGLVPSTVSAQIVPPYDITEVREPCADHDPLRQPYFGTTHLHTGLSFDASIRFVDVSSGNTPRGAYSFARAQSEIILPGPSGVQGPTALRRPRLDPARALDWGGVTDHAELFGEMGICKDFEGQTAPGRLSMECRMLNGFFYQPPYNENNEYSATIASNAFTQVTVQGLGPISRMTRTPVCENNPDTCASAELKVWDEIRMAAEEAYDRTSACTFTSFVAYEVASTPLGVNWHRNVFFRNDRVVQRPVSAIDMGVQTNTSPTTGGPDGVGVPPTSVSLVATEVPDDPEVHPVPVGARVTHPLPERLWNRLDAECLDGGAITGGTDVYCDFLAIPHNSNLGGGNALIPPLFYTPFNAEDARRKAQFEPLVEIYQDKGASECRFDPRPDSGGGVDTLDEFCNFELLDTTSISQASGVGGGAVSSGVKASDFNPRAFVRNVWKDGLELANMPEFEGVNPFKMGVVSASDSHNGTMGFYPEDESFPGHLGIDDAWPVSDPASIQNSTGGYSVVWAEENSRDAIFSALRRKETYGTSGTRIVVRFFGSFGFDTALCDAGYQTLVETGYRDGVPMGGDLRDATGMPLFAVAAMKDDYIGTNLEQIQIIKGWVDFEGNAREQVIAVVGDSGDADRPELGIDPGTCETKPGGYEQLCTVWQDLDFDPTQRAFYYARVLEKPVCRYSTHWCRERIGVDPLLPTEACQAQLDALAETDPTLAAQGAACCSNQTTPTFVQPVIQERAWTSPIWYEPNS